MDNLYLKIVTPDKLFFEGEIVSVTARGIMGDFTILRNHIGFATVLDIWKMKIKTAQRVRMAVVAGGYMTVKNNEVVVMSDACEWEDEIDLNRARLAKERAEKQLRDGSGKDTAKIELELKKAINRLGER